MGRSNYSATYPNDDLVTFSNDRKSVILKFKDGGFGDANGFIVDPGGVGYASSSPVIGSASHRSNVGGCFIATAAYGSYAESHVKILREFRDVYLLRSNAGRWFVNTYYQHSPRIANFIAGHPALRAVVRIALLPAVSTSYAALYATPEEWEVFSLAIFGFFVLLIGAPIFLRILFKR